MKIFVIAKLNFTVTQWIFVSILSTFILIAFLLFLWLLYRMVFKSYAKDYIKELQKEYNEEKKKLALEQKKTISEIKKAESDVNKMSRQAKLAQAEAERLHKDLMELGFQEAEARKYANMTLNELLSLKAQERKDLSSDFVISAITRNVLIESNFEAREDTDFKVPIDKVTDYTMETLEHYLITRPTATLTKNQRNDVYKIAGKSFAMLSKLNDGKFKLTLKCDTYYAGKLNALVPEIFAKATFPSGLIWYYLTNVEKEVSLDLIILLVEISYNIARGGY